MPFVTTPELLHMRVLRNLLWIDCSGALLAAAVMVACSGWLSRLYLLPAELLVGMGAVNAAYGTFSLSLALRNPRPRSLLLLLVIANASWAGLCGIAAVVAATSASAFGVAHLVFEGLYVGGLAVLEWSNREVLLDPTTVVHATSTT